MTQDQRPRNNKRAARQARNRPVLVTPGENGEVSTEQPVQEAMPTLETSMADIEEQNPPVAPTKRRLPNFFSTVGRRTETESPEKAAEVRVARATSKVASTKNGKAVPEKNTSSEKTEEKETARPKPNAPARPTSPFKPRYLLGMMIYLLGANFIGSYERIFLSNNKMDQNLFSIFGVQINTSTLVFLATLVLLLLLLVRLDLIPRSFSAMSGRPSQPVKRNQPGNRETTDDGERTTLPRVRQGVSGADDDLYQEYRANQRREKKK